MNQFEITSARNAKRIDLTALIQNLNCTELGRISFNCNISLAYITFPKSNHLAAKRALVIINRELGDIFSAQIIEHSTVLLIVKNQRLTEQKND